MPLPAIASDEAGLRQLEPKCADQESPAARRTVRQLVQTTQAYREAIMLNCTMWGLANLVRCATEAGVSPDLIFPASQTPLITRAAFEGHSRVVRVLLGAGADCDLVDSRGCTVVHRAAQGGHLECVELLLAAGADPRKQYSADRFRADQARGVRKSPPSSIGITLALTPPASSASSSSCLSSPTWMCEQDQAWTRTAEHCLVQTNCAAPRLSRRSFRHGQGSAKAWRLASVPGQR
jgi:hypothetical protein